MTPQEQRVAIATACGWKKEGSLWICPVTKRGWATDYPPPNYVSDLNAMHEAEKMLTEEQMLDYIGKYLRETCQSRWTCATAAQRAEAFLLSLGKWKKSETAT